MRLTLHRSSLLLVSWLMTCAFPVGAATSLSSTRMVILQSEGRGAISVRNVDPAPALVQAWIDDGRTDLPPEQIDTPFQLVPPMARIEADASLPLQVLIVKSDQLPTDREALYWLNVVEIPREDRVSAAARSTDNSMLNVRVRSRIKMIYRPAALQGQPADGIRRMSWTLSADGTTLTVGNPSPWMVNLAKVVVDGTGEATLDNGVVPPLSTQVFKLPAAQPGARQVAFQWIDDYGAANAANAELASAQP